ncbi:NUDIX domain-containing protein [Microbacterium sp. gxy059]
MLDQPRRRIVLVLRGTEPEKGRWSVPGGRCEPHETFADAAAREAREETGLRVAIGEEPWGATAPAGDRGLFEIHDFAATVLDGRVAPADDAADARWFSPRELDDVSLARGLATRLDRAGVFASP